MVTMTFQIQRGILSNREGPDAAHLHLSIYIYAFYFLIWPLIVVRVLSFTWALSFKLGVSFFSYELGFSFLQVVILRFLDITREAVVLLNKNQSFQASLSLEFRIFL